jgi:all-trans-retinol dehydrogenase (NAD+)
MLKAEIERTMGFVDILVNNAGILSTISLREGQPKDLQKLVDVNLVAHLWVTFKQKAFLQVHSVLSQTVRTFLDTMIERKRGHIVAVASMGGKVSIPLAIGYCATKFGVRGFMNALYDELCAMNHDEFVKVTTVYPAFINTRKELSDVLDQTKEMTPRMTPEFVADEVVKGVLTNKLDITLPTCMAALQIVK